MSRNLDMSLDDIIVREGIGINGPKRKFNDSNKPFNNNRLKTNDDVDEELMQKKTKFGETDDEIATNETNSSGFATHFDEKCGAIFVDNIKYGVTDDDIQTLFSSFGKLKRAAVNFRSDGRSSGSGFVVFENKSDAITAHKSLNNVTLDGRPLQLSLINCNTDGKRRGGNFNTRIGLNQPKFSASSGRQVWSDIAKNYDSSLGSDVNNRRQRFNNKFNSENDSKPKVNIEDLDADLESYLAQRNN